MIPTALGAENKVLAKPVRLFQSGTERQSFARAGFRGLDEGAVKPRSILVCLIVVMRVEW